MVFITTTSRITHSMLSALFILPKTEDFKFLKTLMNSDLVTCIHLLPKSTIGMTPTRLDRRESPSMTATQSEQT